MSNDTDRNEERARALISSLQPLDEVEVSVAGRGPYGTALKARFLVEALTSRPERWALTLTPRES